MKRKHVLYVLYIYIYEKNIVSLALFEAATQKRPTYLTLNIQVDIYLRFTTIRLTIFTIEIFSVNH